MAKLIRVPSIPAPSVQEGDSETEDEQRPILGSGESGRKKSVKRQDSVVDVVRHIKHPSTWNWWNLMVLPSLEHSVMRQTPKCECAHQIDNLGMI